MADLIFLVKRGKQYLKPQNADGSGSWTNDFMEAREFTDEDAATTEAKRLGDGARVMAID